MTSFKAMCLVVRELLGLAIITAVVVGARQLSAEELLPSQEQALTRVVENHPDIVAAKAKVALAESELNSKKMEVSRQIIGLYGASKDLDAQISRAKASHAVARFEDQKNREAVVKAPGALSEIELNRSAAVVKEKEAQLLQLLSQRDQIEKELRLLIGAAPAAKSDNPATRSATARQMPQGATVEKIKRQLADRTSLEFVETPLQEATGYLSSKHEIPIHYHPGLPKGMMVTIELKDVSLAAALQAIEDFNNGQIQFVVRDYGILLMFKAEAEKNGFVSAIDFNKDTGGKASNPTSGHSEALRPPAKRSDG